MSFPLSGCQNTHEEAGFNLESLVVCTLDMAEAGIETVATTLRWALFFMIKYPEIQGRWLEWLGHWVTGHDKAFIAIAIESNQAN